MKNTLFITTSLAAALSANAEMVDYVQSTTNGTWVWGTVTITEQNQHNYLTVPDTEGNYVFSGATAAVLNVGVSQGEGSLIITDNGKLVTPNGLFVAGRGINNPDTTYRRNNGSVTVTKGGELTIAGCTWEGPYHNPTVDGAQLSLAYSTNVNATLDITEGGKVHANAYNCVGGGTNCTATVKIEGKGSVMDFAPRGETQASQVQVFVGYNGSSTTSGTITVKDGGLLSGETSSVPVCMYFGIFGSGTGTLNVENATANLGTQVGSGAVLGYSAGTQGFINVTNKGILSSAEIQVGMAGTGTMKVDETSSASVGLLGVGNGTVTNAGTLKSDVTEVSGSSTFTSTGTLNIGTLAVMDNAHAVISAGEGVTLNIGNIVAVFNTENYLTAENAMIKTSGNAAGLTSSAWSFELTKKVAQAIDGGATRWISDMTGVNVASFYSSDTKNWYQALEESGTGTYIGKVDDALKLGDATSAEVVITTTSSTGTVSEGKPIEEGKNTAQVLANDSANLFVNVETVATTDASATQNGVIQVEVTKTMGEGDEQTTQTAKLAVNDAYITNKLTLNKTDLNAQGAVNASGSTINLTHANITSTAIGSVAESTIKGTGTLTNLAISNSTLVAGNSPGTLTLAENKLTGSNTLSFYVGSQAADALQGHDDAVSLTLDDVVVTSGFIIESGTVLSGDITLELWTTEGTFAYTQGRIFDTIGDSLQLFKAGADVDLATALGGANFILGDTFGAATTWGWDTSKLASEGKVYVVVPEPATATLSLLALAGLCVRRRRK